MLRNIFLLILCCFSYLLASCTKEEGKTWVKTEEGFKVWLLPKSDKALYSWNGGSIGGIINGKGILAVYDDNGAFFEEKRIYADLGSIDETDWVNIPDGEYLGKLEENRPTGYGVIKKKNDIVWLSDFKEGKMNGNSMIYNQGRLIYKGKTENDKYEGRGILFENGKIIIGDWEQGRIEESLFNSTSREITRMWNIIAGDSEENIENDVDDFSPYLQGKEVFCDSVISQLSTYMEMQIKETVESRTSFWSFHPIRMFWQTCFTDDADRIEGWMNALDNNGLSVIDLEAILNSKIDTYNQENKKHQLNRITLRPYKKDEIITNDIFRNINDREVAGWQDNIWFDALLGFAIGFGIPYIIGFCLCFFIPTLLPWVLESGWIIDLVFTAIGLIIGLFLFIFGLFSGSIETEIINGLMDSYSNYLSNQDIIGQIIGK